MRYLVKTLHAICGMVHGFHFSSTAPDNYRESPSNFPQRFVKACIKGMIRAYWYMRKQPETFNQCLQMERRLRMESHDPDEGRRKPTCSSPANLEHLPFPYDGMPTNLEGYLQEAVEVGVLDEPPDMEKLGQLKLVQEGFIELENREDVKEDLKRIKNLVGRLGY